MSENVPLDDFVEDENSESVNLELGPIEIDLPEEWDSKKLSNVCKLVTGNNYSGDSLSDENNGGRIFLTLKSINKGGGFNWDSLKYYTGEINEREIVEPGELLIANTDVTQDGDIVGYSARVPDFGSRKEIAASMDLSILRPTSDNINLPYMEYLLQTDYIHSRMRAFSAGSTVLHLNTDLVESLSLPLPALSEQRKIATVLYTIDRAIEKTEEITKKRKKIREGAVQSLLNKGIGHEEYRNARIGPKRVRIPSEWDIKKISEIAEIKNGTRIIPGHDYAEEKTEYPFIRISDMKDGTISTEDIEYLREETASQMNRGIIHSDEVYVTVTGRVGDAGTVPEELDGSHFTDNAAKLYNFEGVTNEYLALYLRSKFGQDEVHRFTVGSNQPKLSMYRVEKMEVLIPKISEQHNIVERISMIDQSITANQKVKRKLNSLKNGLMQDLLSGTVRTTNTNIEVPDEIAQYG